jgi:hypothetical protein
MSMRRSLLLGTTAFAVVAFLAAAPAPSVAQVVIDADDIGGVVTGPSGPEAGAWVIAETTDLPTRYAKMVVTDAQGRYVVPDLPKAKYKIWVRGYGLVDSAKVDGEPGQQLNLRAVAAPNEATAAQYYPAAYWYAMMKIPGADQFGGKSDIPERIKQTDWLNNMKNNGCVGCHQLGQISTRTFPKGLGEFATHNEAWVRRTQSGQSGVLMVNILAGLLNGTPIKYFADWTERIEKGELPKQKPERPAGIERNIVVTTWDMGEPDRYLHDLITTDKRNPTVNAYGPILGSPEYSTDTLPLLDPKTHKVSMFKAPVRDADTPEGLGPGHAAMDKALGPSPYWGMKKIWDTKVNNHNAMVDGKGRFWLAAAMRANKNPAFCQKGSDHPSAKAFPLESNHRGLTMLDPKTMKYSFIDTCFQTHHLQFGFDANDTLWTSGGGQVVGWVNTKMLEETGDAVKSQGWTPFILDYNGDGKRGEYTEPNQPADPSKDRRLNAGGFYAVMPSPLDGSVWGSVRASPGSIIRLAPGSNPTETALAEIYNVPMPGFGVRGADIDSKGVVWVSLASGHIGSFDRTKCKGPLNGPTAASGNHCPEGWAFHQYPGPGFEGIGQNSVESSYYSWVDQHDTFGMGKDVPMSTANLMDGIAALGKDGKMVSLKVPYPLGFYAKGFDGRIDDPNAGWKGRGLWVSSGDRAPWLQEGGQGMKPMAVQFQLRPDPLAK